MSAGAAPAAPDRAAHSLETIDQFTPPTGGVAWQAAAVPLSPDCNCKYE